MTRVFICYSRNDEEFVDRLTSDLKDEQVPTWRDKDDIPRDTAANTSGWRRAVDKALQKCTHMIVVLSPNSVESDEVMAEWNYFLKAKRPVYPVLFSECEIPYRLAALQVHDLSKNYRPNLQNLVSLILPEQVISRQLAPKGHVSLSRDEARVYSYYRKFCLENGFPPTNREIREATGLNSSGRVAEILERLPLVGLMDELLNKPRITSKSSMPKSDSVILAELTGIEKDLIRFAWHMFEKGQFHLSPRSLILQLDHPKSYLERALQRCLRYGIFGSYSDTKGVRYDLTIRGQRIAKKLALE